MRNIGILKKLQGLSNFQRFLNRLTKCKGKRACCFKTCSVLCFVSNSFMLKAAKTLKQNTAKLPNTSVLLYPVTRISN